MKPLQWHLAQVNVGRIAGVNMTDPVMSGFVSQLDEVNSLAESSKGFVWRLKDDNNNATSFNPFNDDRIIINLSVWESIDDLVNYIYKGRHAEVLKSRKDWFVNFGKPFVACWYIPAGHIPTIGEAVARLTHLQDNGPSGFAFDLRKRFPPPLN